MKFKIVLENGESCTGHLEEEETRFLQEKVKIMEEYRKKYGKSTKWNVAREIAHGVVPEYIAEHKNDR